MFKNIFVWFLWLCLSVTHHMSVLVDADLQFITSGAMNSIVPWNDDDHDDSHDDDHDDDHDKIPQACSTQCYLPRRPLRLAQSQWSWCRPFAAIVNMFIRWIRCWWVNINFYCQLQYQHNDSGCHLVTKENVVRFHIKVDDSKVVQEGKSLQGWFYFPMLIFILSLTLSLGWRLWQILMIINGGSIFQCWNGKIEVHRRLSVASRILILP